MTELARLALVGIVGGIAVFAAAALLLVASVSGKLVGIALAGRILGWAKGEASLIGWLLLREPMPPMRLLACAVIALGVVLLKLA